MIVASDLDWIILRFGAVPPPSPSRKNALGLKEMFAIDPGTRVEYVDCRDAGLAQARAVSCDEAVRKILLIGGGKSCQIHMRDLYDAALDAMGVGSFPDSAYGEEPCYTDWLDTEESQRLLQYQRYGFALYRDSLMQQDAAAATGGATASTADPPLHAAPQPDDETGVERRVPAAESDAMTDWDVTTDLLVVGSGAGAMTAALVAKREGLDSLVVEKTEFYGGSSACSGGGLWVPNNPLMAEAGFRDSLEKARAYMDATVGDRVPAARKEAFLTKAPEMVAYLLQHSQSAASSWSRRTRITTRIDPAP